MNAYPRTVTERVGCILRWRTSWHLHRLQWSSPAENISLLPQHTHSTSSALSRPAADGGFNLSTLLRLASLSHAALKSHAHNRQQSDQAWDGALWKAAALRPGAQIPETGHGRSILSSGRDFKIKGVLHGEAVAVAW